MNISKRNLATQTQYDWRTNANSYFNIRPKLGKGASALTTVCEGGSSSFSDVSHKNTDNTGLVGRIQKYSR